MLTCVIFHLSYSAACPSMRAFARCYPLPMIFFSCIHSLTYNVFLLALLQNQRAGASAAAASTEGHRGTAQFAAAVRGRGHAALPARDCKWHARSHAVLARTYFSLCLKLYIMIAAARQSHVAGDMSHVVGAARHLLVSVGLARVSSSLYVCTQSLFFSRIHC